MTRISMYHLILNACLAITLACGCSHVKKTASGRMDPLAHGNLGPAFCSEGNANAQNLRLTVDITNQGNKTWTFHKQVDLPYFKQEGAISLPRTARDLLIWRDDHVVLAEVTPIEKTEDLFMVSITSFERTKNMPLYSSSAFIIVRLCENGEIALGGVNQRHTLKIRLELLEKSLSK